MLTTHTARGKLSHGLMLITSIFFCFAGCTSVKEASLEIGEYKEASFRSWLFFKERDTYYSPPAISRAIFLRPMPEEVKEQIGGDTKTIRYFGDKYYAIPGREPGIWYPPHAWVGYQGNLTSRKPTNYPWETDTSQDINIFMEKLDLKKFAKLIYGNQLGRIFFMKGEREISFYTRLIAGYVPPNVYVPARLITESDLNLSMLMNNIALLFQLERDGWITKTGRDSWRWTAQARALKKGEQSTLSDMDMQTRDYFKALTLITDGNESLPAIPCRVIKTCETVGMIDAEVRLMRKNEGCNMGPLPKKRYFTMDEEVGYCVLLGTTSCLQSKGKKQSYVQLRVFATDGDIRGTYGVSLDRILQEGGIPKRICRIIYDRKR